MWTFRGFWVWVWVPFCFVGIAICCSEFSLVCLYCGLFSGICSCFCGFSLRFCNFGFVGLILVLRLLVFCFVDYFDTARLRACMICVELCF